MVHGRIAKVTLSDITLSEIALADVCREIGFADCRGNNPFAAAMFEFTFQAGRCYPQSEAPVINTAGLMSDTLRRTGTPQECYDYCTGSNSGFSIMGLDLRPTGGQDCTCKVAEDDYNDGADCKRRAGRWRSKTWTGPR